MTCACIKNDFRFTLDILDKQFIVYRDISTWMEGFTYENRTEYQLSVLFPGQFDPKNFTVNNYENVKLNLGKIIDGVYEFSTDNCGKIYTRCKLLIPNLECCYKKGRLKAEESQKEKFREIGENIEMMKACVELGDNTTANELLKITKRLLNNLNCDCGKC